MGSNSSRYPNRQRRQLVSTDSSKRWRIFELSKGRKTLQTAEHMCNWERRKMDKLRRRIYWSESGIKWNGAGLFVERNGVRTVIIN